MYEFKYAITFDMDAPSMNMKPSSLWPIAEIVGVCAGLVSVEAESGNIMLLHWTAKRYFETHLTAIDTGAMVKPNRPAEKTQEGEQLAISTHRQLALACVTYLSSDIFQSGPCPTEKQLAQRLYVYPLYRYASKNWGRHVRIILQNLDRKTTDLILAFLKNDRKVAASSQAQEYWTTTHSLLAISILPKMEESLVWGPNFGLGLRKVPDRIVTQVPSGAAMHVASSFGLTPFVKSLLETKHQPDSADGSGMTPLCHAASVGEASLVSLLLSSRYRVNPVHQSPNGFTPLCWAARNGHKDTVQVLLSVDTSNSSRGFALKLAQDRGHSDVVRLLN